MNGPELLRRGWVLRLEAMWWMTRPPSVATALIVVPGWLAATAPPSDGRLAAMVGAVMCGRAIANVVNDLLDEEKDRVTAPELPLPSGLVTRQQAISVAAVLIMCELVLLWIAGGGLATFAIGVGGSAACGALVCLYSLVKPYAFIAVTITGLAYLSCPVTAWLVAGAGWSAEVGLVFVYALCRGLAANVFSTYRDVDRDGDVGNYSIAVRLGRRLAFGLGVSIEAIAAACVFGIAILRQEILLGATVTAVSFALFTYASLATLRRWRQPSGGDENRSLLILPLRISRNHAAVIFVQSAGLGLIAASITVMGLGMEVLYSRRMIRGDLRRALDSIDRPGAPSVVARDIGY